LEEIEVEAGPTSDDDVKEASDGGSGNEVWETRMEREVAEYLTEEVKTGVDDVLHYWRTEGKSRFPLLALAARVLLSIPVNSAGAERTISGLEDTMAPKRRRMLGDTVGRLVYLGKGLRVLFPEVYRANE